MPVSRRRQLITAGVMLAASTALNAAPWLEPGDARARHSLQKLADRGHYDKGVTTWPVMWADIDSGVSNSIAADAGAVSSQAAYLNFEREQLGSPGVRFEIQASGSTEATSIRGFASQPKEKGELSVNLQWQGEYVALGVKPSVVANASDDETLRLDGSYLAATPGNWVVGAGAIERWWGPGWQSAMVLSTNARPMPAVWLNRKDTSAPESDWLKWIGPWNLTVFAGEMEEERIVSDIRLVGMRLNLRPIQGLDLGFTRAIMFGGEGYPGGFSTFWDAFIGNDNSYDGSDPGNQIGAIDIRYGFPVEDQAMSVYMEMMGEDEAGYIPSRKSWLFGVDWTSQLLGADQQWFFEFTNTLADDIVGEAIPNYAYGHFRYRTGYQYYGRNMGSTFDGDAEALTAGLFHFLPDGSNVSLALTYADLNNDGGNRVSQPDNDIFYFAPDGAQKVAIVKAGYGTEVLKGWLDLNLQATDKKIELLGGEQDQWTASASWTYRF
ncbi:capsule assembly Wzi family protein [Marinobacter sp. ST-43]|uniref:capsule assembly Wzi family protein n=1 Tax=Marinobacter sp. ST-43 TaxID=3050453 RepID=UPI0026E0160B|nr:capsule assembly Wzi family protein [Marinobacter sp. ST-43]